jgi:hypothetical protein
MLMGTSERIVRRIGRRIVASNLTGELHDASGTDDRLVLKRHPITAVSEVRVDGTAIAAASYASDDDAGILYRRNEDDPDATSDVWPRGRRHIAVDYSSGYVSVPEDLVTATVLQAASLWRLSVPGGNRLGQRGTILDAGGSAQFLTGPWAPGVLQMIDNWRQSVVA